MSIKRYVSTKDATITNAYNDTLRVRAVQSNMGASDSLEIFSMYGRTSQEETEISRVLVYFPMEGIQEDRDNLKIGLPGKTQFLMKLSNIEHRNSTPHKFTLSINPLSSSWNEGIGLDMDSYKDRDSVNWLSSSFGTKWQQEGGDYYQDIQFDKYFETGLEDLEVDITELVEMWLTGSLPNHGVLVRLSSSIEEGQESYYTKKFSSRSSEYFYNRPWIEARTDDSIKDDRARFFKYTDWAPMEENYNSLFIYNKYKGGLHNFPTIGTGSMKVGLYTTRTAPLPQPLLQVSGSDDNLVSVLFATASYVSQGVYKCDVCINTNEEVIYDIWFNDDQSFAVAGGPIYVKDPNMETTGVEDNIIYNVKNLKSTYSTKDQSTIQVYSRLKTWNPNSYTSVASQDNIYLPENLYYKVFRVVDNKEVIPYGTGSYNHTRLSRNKDSNFFQLDFGLFEPGYSYGLKFVAIDRQKIIESKEVFKFRVE